MTPYSEIYEAFLDRINKDTEFFIQDENVEKVKEIAEVRMKKLLDKAIYEIMISEGKRDLELNFMEVMNNDESQFDEDLNIVEVQLIADLMFQGYVNEQVITRIDAMKRAGFEDSEIKIILHSPANALKEFSTMFDKLARTNQKKIRDYRNKHRSNMKYKSFNFNLE